MKIDKLMERKIRRAKASGLSYAAVAKQTGAGIGLVLRVFRSDYPDEPRRGPCQKCGKDERFRIHHHTDYIKGTVIMICPGCHSHPAMDMIRIRLKPKEFAMLDSLLANDITGIMTRSELIRLLIYRECNRRKRLGPPKACDYQTAFRKGRPLKQESADELPSPRPSGPGAAAR